MTMYGRRAIEMIDDALILKARHPVLFARLSQDGYSCADFSMAYDMWLRGERLSSTLWAYTESPATRRRAKANRKRNKVARASRKANR